MATDDLQDHSGENNRNILFGLLAVESGCISPKEVQRGIQFLKARPDADIAEWLLPQGLLSETDYAAINDRLKQRLSDSEVDLRNSDLPP